MAATSASSWQMLLRRGSCLTGGGGATPSSSSPTMAMSSACGCSPRRLVAPAAVAGVGIDHQTHARNARGGLCQLEATPRRWRAHAALRRGPDDETITLLRKSCVDEGADQRRGMKGMASCNDCWFSSRKQSLADSEEVYSGGATELPLGSQVLGTMILSSFLTWHAQAAQAVTEGPDLAQHTVSVHDQVYGDVSAALESGLQLVYLAALLALLGGGTFLVVRQILVRRELENAAKELQLRVRSGEATSQEYFDLGAVMLRKKLYVQANKYLEQAIKKWEGDEANLAQVYNALGFSYFSEGKAEQAAIQYEKALKLQPGYITALNNLGDALEKLKRYERAWEAYSEVLSRDPGNHIAKMRIKEVQERKERLRGVEVKD